LTTRPGRAAMSRLAAFVQERRYLKNVSPSTVSWYVHAFKWLPSESPSQEELKDAVMRMRATGLRNRMQREHSRHQCVSALEQRVRVQVRRGLKSSAHPAVEKSRKTNEKPTVLALLGLVQLLGEIIFVGHFFDRVQLPFQPVDVVFFIEQYLLQQVARTVVADRHADFDPFI